MVKYMMPMIRKRLTQLNYNNFTRIFVFLLLFGNSTLLPYGSAYSNENIPLQSVSMWEFSTQITFEKSVSEILEQGALMDQNISIFLVVETDETILGIMIVYLTFVSDSVWYSVGNPEIQSPLWSKGLESVHFQHLDSGSIECNFLELSAYLNGNYIRSRVLAFYTNNSPEEIQQDFVSILSNEAENCIIANYVWVAETTSTTSTTTSEDPSDDSSNDSSDDASDDDSTRLKIPGYSSIFIIGALSILIVLFSSKNKT